MEGRKLLQLSEIKALKTEKVIFRDEQKYDLDIEGFNFNSTTFISLGLKTAKFKGGAITNSTFESIYAKRASFSNVDFSGTTFKNCNFGNAKFSMCNFRYCSFSNCLLPIDDIIGCLPKEPNLRKEVANSIKVNYNAIGKRAEADIFLDIQIKAEQQERLEIFRCKTSYYKERYGILDRIKACFIYLRTLLSKLVWGYGHRLDLLAFSYITIMLMISSFVFCTGAKFSPTDIVPSTPRPLNFFESLVVVFGETVKYSYTSLTPYDTLSKGILFFIRFLGTFYLGLLGASLFRRINK